MSRNRNYSNNGKQSTEEPILLRMLHPTSGRQGFNEVNNTSTSPSQPTMDPRFAMMMNMQTQQAIAASGISYRIPYQGAPIPRPSPYVYGIYQPYLYYPNK